MDALRDYWESNAASIGPLLERFIALFQSYKAEFHDYKVHILCLKLVSETLEKRIEGWNGPTLASVFSYNQYRANNNCMMNISSLLD
jgi:hypothetical protein